MSISQDTLPRVTLWENPAARITNYGVIIYQGESLNPALPPTNEDELANKDTTTTPYLSVTAAVHNSFLARKCRFTPNVVPEVVAETVVNGTVTNKEDVRASKLARRRAQLGNAFTHVMNFTDTIGAILANFFFKIEPTKGFGYFALPFSTTLATASRVALFAIGSAVCVGVIAPTEFVGITAYLTGKFIVKPLWKFIIKPVAIKFGNLCVKVGGIALNVIVNFPSISLRTLQLSGVLIYHFAKTLVYSILAAVFFSGSAAIDIARLSIFAIAKPLQFLFGYIIFGSIKEDFKTTNDNLLQLGKLTPGANEFKFKPLTTGEFDFTENVNLLISSSWVCKLGSRFIENDSKGYKGGLYDGINSIFRSPKARSSDSTESAPLMQRITRAPSTIPSLERRVTSSSSTTQSPSNGASDDIESIDELSPKEQETLEAARQRGRRAFDDFLSTPGLVSQSNS